MANKIKNGLLRKISDKYLEAKVSIKDGQGNYHYGICVGVGKIQNSTRIDLLVEDESGNFHRGRHQDALLLSKVNKDETGNNKGDS